MAVLGVVVHEFVRYAGIAPYLSTDDALVNVSYTLMEYGRLGLLTSPLQGGTLAIRADHFFNYGPWYFIGGAGLAWLFGPSLVLQRALHPIGLGLFALAALPALRKHGLVAWAIFAILLFLIFDRMHWPMVRPDIAVSVMAGLMLLGAHLALRTNSRLGWMLIGAGAVGAFSAHQIAWGFCLAAITYWGLSIRLGSIDLAKNRPWWWGVLWGCVGAAPVFVLWMWLIDFRLNDLVNLWFAYKSQTSDSVRLSMYEVLRLHYQTGLAGLPFVLWWGALLSALLAVVALFRTFPGSRGMLAQVAPPLFLGLAYFLSLALYPNRHSGYYIVLQGAIVWTAVAGPVAILGILHERFPAMHRRVLLLAGVFVAAWGVSLAGSLLRADNGLQAQARTWVPIQDYVDRLVESVPQRATAWGSAMLGMESGTRIDLVQYTEGITLAEQGGTAFRDAIAPEYLLFGYPELRDFLWGWVRDGQAPGFLTRLYTLFPDADFDPVAVVYATPYGQSYVFQRRLKTDPVASHPSVDVWDGAARRWSNGVGPALDVSVEPVDGMVVHVGDDGGRFSRPLPVAKKLSGLPAGDYLVNVTLSGVSDAESGAVVAAHALVSSHVRSELTLGVQFGVILGGSGRSQLILHHPGGDAYIGVLARPGVGFDVSDVRSIGWLTPVDTDDHWIERKIPVVIAAPATWNEFVTMDGGKVVPTGDGGLEVEGSRARWAYQLTSAPIEVPENYRVRLRLPVSSETGDVGVGLLGETGQWLVSPVRTKDGVIEFGTGGNSHVTVVVANDLDQEDGRRSRFVVRPGEMHLVGPEVDQYTDLLTTCQRETDSPLCQ